MKKIKKLPPHLIAQIAAGEVIERPSYAVKELIDNSIDAGATTISVQIENAGLKKIVVTDNGEGMSTEDLKESIKVHTTSKIFSEDSLAAIPSLGFRGEALASIAAISHIIVRSKREQDLAGTEIEVKNGNIEKVVPVGIPTGTTIEVNNIFSSVPARKKFLKSPSTEFRHIVEVFNSFTLAYPHIRFSLIHNGKTLLDLPKTTDLFIRIESLLGSDLAQNVIPIKSEDSYLKIEGFLAKPQITTQSQTKQYIFVNNRRISDRLISLAVKDAYDNLLSPRTYPVFLLYLSIPFELVDVNVHPRKEQVGFVNNELLYNSIVKTVQKTLAQYNLTFANASFTKDPITSSQLGKALRSETNPWQVKNQPLKIDYSSITQFHNLYLVTQTKEGIIFIDQHAAHERILFEQFKKEFLNKKLQKETFKLPRPVDLKLTLSERTLIEEYKQIFISSGLVFTTEYNLIQIPSVFKDRDIKKLLNELFENIIEGKGLKAVDEISNKIIQFLACKSAIKAGDYLTKLEAQKLIKKLEQTENNYTCPHGRPTKYVFSISQLNNLFKR